MSGEMKEPPPQKAGFLIPKLEASRHASSLVCRSKISLQSLVENGPVGTIQKYEVDICQKPVYVENHQGVYHAEIPGARGAVAQGVFAYRIIGALVGPGVCSNPEKSA